MSGVLDDRVNWRRDKLGFNSPVAEMMSNELKSWTLEAIESVEDNDDIFDKSQLKKEFHEKIVNNQQWNDSLEFWKKINTIKLIQIYKKRKS